MGRRGRRIGRNEPCPCGSGKKYKKCCLRREGVTTPPPADRFRFEPGSYGGPGKGFAPALACYKRAGEGAWDVHLVLVNPAQAQDKEHTASSLATLHLEDAFAEKQHTGSDQAMAMKLSSKGYVRIDDFHIVGPDAETSTEAFRASTIADLGQVSDGPVLGEAIREAVDRQIRDNDPPETRETFDRLVGSGHSQEHARELIATVLAVEAFEMMKHEREFERSGFVAALSRLPGLPAGLEG